MEEIIVNPFSDEITLEYILSELEILLISEE